MNITELHNLSAIEKLKIIEALWGDLAGDESNLPNLAWHETELKETEEKFSSWQHRISGLATSQERIANSRKKS